RSRGRRHHRRHDRAAENRRPRTRVARRSPAARGTNGSAQAAPAHLPGRGPASNSSDRDSGERDRDALGRRVRRRAPRAGGAARDALAHRDGVAQRGPADQGAQQGPPERHLVRQADELRRRRGRQRRSAVVAAAVGARCARRRAQRRQLQPVAQRDTRRVGAVDRTRGQRIEDADDHHFPKLMSSLSKVVLVAGAALAAAFVLPLEASSPKFFQAATQAEFLKGDVENLSIDSRGELSLGPAAELVYESAAPFLWSVVAQPDGTLFVGSGNEGKVFKIDAQGRGALFFDSAELEVHALALAPNGGLFVATSPDGKIYLVDRNGTGKPFFTAEDKYIWALAADGKGNVFAGTGDKGVIYKIAPDGKGVPFYKTNATHAPALAFDKAGNLLVGTGTPGKVIRIDPDGKPFVLLDSPFQEIRSLRFDDKGTLYAAALSGRGPSGVAPATSDTGAAATPD